MFVGYNKLKIKASYILTGVMLVALIITYFYSAWAASKRYQEDLPREASEKIVNGLMSFEKLAGRFPNNLNEVEDLIWKHKNRPSYGDTGRTLFLANYHYIYFNKDQFTVTLWALPAGPRREEASAYFFYITTKSIRKWKGPELSDDDIKRLTPLPDEPLLGVLGMTEQPVVEVGDGLKQQNGSAETGKRQGLPTGAK